MLISSNGSGRICSYASLIVTIMILDSVILSILHTHLCKLYMPLTRLDLPVLLPYLFFPANVTQTAKLVKTTPEKWEVDLYISVGQFATLKRKIWLLVKLYPSGCNRLSMSGWTGVMLLWIHCCFWMEHVCWWVSLYHNYTKTRSLSHSVFMSINIPSTDSLSVLSLIVYPLKLKWVEMNWTLIIFSAG